MSESHTSRLNNQRLGFLRLSGGIGPCKHEITMVAELQEE